MLEHRHKGMTDQPMQKETSTHSGRNELQCARDKKLAKRVLAGDRQAFDELCTEYMPKLYRFASMKLRDDALVEEALQLTLSAAARYMHSYRGEASLYTWLTTICRREMAKLLQREDRYHEPLQSWQDDQLLRSVIESFEAPDSEQPDQLVYRQELIGLIQAVLDRLPGQQGDALEMKYVEGLGSKEIARRLDMSDKAVQSLLARARGAFRELCGEVFAAHGHETGPALWK